MSNESLAKPGPVARQLRIQGRVQGVYFRASMVAEAERLGVAGWVRNRADGSVEALAQGQPDAVQALIEWAHRGPQRARVDAVTMTEASAEPTLTGFEQRATSE